jgi:RimJ/RimL family protein N-acetyltransferase
MDVPVIRTARLILRGHSVADFAASAAMWGDPRVTRHIGGRPFASDEVWTRLLRYAGHWALLGYGYWVVTEAATGAFVGEVGLADFKRIIDPPLTDPEAGWALVPEAQGRGYATEAVGAALSWAADHLDCGRTLCLISPPNQPSLRVAAACGYCEFVRTTYKGEPTILLERPNS